MDRRIVDLCPIMCGFSLIHYTLSFGEFASTVGVILRIVSCDKHLDKRQKLRDAAWRNYDKKTNSAMSTGLLYSAGRRHDIFTRLESRPSHWPAMFTILETALRFFHAFSKTCRHIFATTLNDIGILQTFLSQISSDDFRRQPEKHISINYSYTTIKYRCVVRPWNMSFQ